MAFTNIYSILRPLNSEAARNAASEIRTLRLDMDERLAQIVGGIASLVGEDPLVDGVTVKSLADLTTANANTVTKTGTLTANDPVLISGSTTIAGMTGNMPTKHALITTSGAGIHLHRPDLYQSMRIELTENITCTSSAATAISGRAYFCVAEYRSAAGGFSVSGSGSVQFSGAGGSGTGPTPAAGKAVFVSFIFIGGASKMYEIARSEEVTY